MVKVRRAKYGQCLVTNRFQQRICLTIVDLLHNPLTSTNTNDSITIVHMKILGSSRFIRMKLQNIFWSIIGKLVKISVGPGFDHEAEEKLFGAMVSQSGKT